MVFLYPSPQGEDSYGSSRLGLVLIETKWRITGNVAIWNPEFLRAIAIGAPNIYEFEDKATDISRRLRKPVIAPFADMYCIQTINAVTRGAWTPEARDMDSKFSVGIDFSQKPSWEPVEEDA